MNMFSTNLVSIIESQIKIMIEHILLLKIFERLFRNLFQKKKDKRIAVCQDRV